MKKKICFVGLDNYPVLNPAKGDAYFGGEAVQQTLLAKAFRDLGYEVSMVDRDFGQPDGELVDGITVWKTMKEGQGLPGLRFLHPRLTSIHRALTKADADIYFQSCAGIMTGATAWYATRKKRKFIFRIAHDTDCIPGQHILGKHYWRDEKFYTYGLRRAGLISAQSEIQKRLLHENFGLDSTIINMAVQVPEEDLSAPRDIDVLWVNNIRQFKRPELVGEVAARLPHLQFTMIGGPIAGSEQLYESVKAQAAQIPNLNYLGQVPYHAVNGYFARAKTFLNTSDSEGFPNSFLQAWIRGVPVISFFDPDGLIKSRELGGVPADLDDMVSILSGLHANSEKIGDLSTRVREFAMQHHAPTKVAEKYIEWIDNTDV